MLETSEEKLQWLIDRTQISELLFSFASALDNKNWQAYVDNYADEGCIELPDPKSDSGATFILRKPDMLQTVPRSLGRYGATHQTQTDGRVVLVPAEKLSGR